MTDFALHQDVAPGLDLRLKDELCVNIAANLNAGARFTADSSLDIQVSFCNDGGGLNESLNLYYRQWRPLLNLRECRVQRELNHGD